MPYDFTSILDRKGKDALAIDWVGVPGSPYPAPRDGFDVIPMWVADMNFPVAPSIQAALLERIQHPVFGYFDPPDAYFDTIIRWQETQYGVTGLTSADIGYENGVIGGVITALNVLCSRGDPVLVHSPTYVGYTHALEDNGYHIIHSPLVQDAEGIWRMDFADMEEKLRRYQIHAAIFCSPHNPCGRVWERREIEQVMALFKKYHVMVISDEIWGDILLPGYRHIPTQTVSEDAKMRTVALYSPSKTFNLAGLVGSYHIIYNPLLRDRCQREGNLSGYNNGNVLSMHALLGAYCPEGAQWVEALRQAIAGNIDFACRYIEEHFTGVEVSRPQGTYMLFLDCGKWLAAHGKSMDELLKMGWDVGVVWQDGRAFHGQTHIRMNLALPLSRVEEAFRRLDRYVFSADG